MEVPDERSDIYALGATMYVLLTGREPVEAIDRMMGEYMSSSGGLVCNISPAVDAAVMRALASKPEDRFQSVAELHVALNTAMQTGLGGMTPRPHSGATADPSQQPAQARQPAGVTIPLPGCAPGTQRILIGARQQLAEPVPPDRMGLLARVGTNKRRGIGVWRGLQP